MSKKKIWLLVVLVALTAGLSYAAYAMFIHSEAGYFTVSGLRAQGDTLSRQPVRVRGTVVPGSVAWDGATAVLRFALTDEKNSVNISHKGMAPDNFKPGAELIVKGKYGTDGSFEAVGFARPRSVCNLCH